MSFTLEAAGTGKPVKNCGEACAPLSQCKKKWARVQAKGMIHVVVVVC